MLVRYIQVVITLVGVVGVVQIVVIGCVHATII